MVRSYILASSSHQQTGRYTAPQQLIDMKCPCTYKSVSASVLEAEHCRSSAPQVNNTHPIHAICMQYLCRRWLCTMISGEADRVWVTTARWERVGMDVREVNPCVKDPEGLAYHVGSTLCPFQRWSHTIESVCQRQVITGGELAKALLTASSSECLMAANCVPSPIERLCLQRRLPVASSLFGKGCRLHLPPPGWKSINTRM